MITLNGEGYSFERDHCKYWRGTIDYDLVDDQILGKSKKERLEFCRVDKERWLTNLARFVAFLSENSVVPSFRAREITFSSEFGEKCD